MILFFGPYSPPYHGQSLAFKSVVDNYEGQIYVVDTSRFRSAVLNTLFASLKVLWLFLTRSNIHTVYFTCTRSVFGSLKDIFLLLLCRIKGVRVINHLHGSDFRNFISNSFTSFRRLLTWLYRIIDVSIVLTDSMRQEFSDFPDMKVIVIRNFYSNHFDRKELPERSKLTITFFSNLLYSKGIMDFLEASKLVGDPDVRYQIAGKFTSDKFKTAKSIEEEVLIFLQANEKIDVEYCGVIVLEERFDFLANSDILILPTFYQSEGIPLSIIEAMRCGNAIISTNFKSIPELVKPENGVLVNTNRPSEISREILNYKSNPDKLAAVQKHNAAEAKEKYNESRYLKEVYEVINRSTVSTIHPNIPE